MSSVLGCRRRTREPFDDVARAPTCILYDRTDLTAAGFVTNPGTGKDHQKFKQDLIGVGVSRLLIRRGRDRLGVCSTRGSVGPSGANRYDGHLSNELQSWYHQYYPVASARLALGDRYSYSRGVPTPFLNEVDYVTATR